MNKEEKYMKYALKEAKKAEKKGDVPIGAVIIRNNKIVARAYNQIEIKKNSIFHAEILAISKASKKKKNWRLDDCILYTTMEPCLMCCGAILQSRIKKIVYGAKNESNNSKILLKNVDIKSNVCEEECRKLITNFFKKIR